MRVFKTTYRERQGVTQESSKWYVEFRDHAETIRRLPAFTSKQASEAFGQNLEKLISYHRATGGLTDPVLQQWLSQIPQSARERLVEIGLLDGERAAVSKPLSKHLDDFPAEGDARTRLRYIWDKYLDLGAHQPEHLKVLAQLRASGKLFKENETPARAFVEVLRAVHDAVSGSELETAPPEMLVLMFRAQAEMAIDFIQANPECAESCREMGFRMVWMGLTGK